MFSPASEQVAGHLSLSAFQFIEEAQQVGANLQSRLAYPEVQDIATRLTFNLRDLMNDPRWEIRTDDLDFQVELNLLGLSSIFPIVREYEIVCTFPRPGTLPATRMLSWSGAVGRGVLSMSSLQRIEARDIEIPFISQVCQAVCQQERVLQDLRHVFMSAVDNVDTLDVMRCTALCLTSILTCMFGGMAQRSTKHYWALRSVRLSRTSFLMPLIRERGGSPRL